MCTQVLIDTAVELGIKHHKVGTNVTIEGPRFSTQAESKLFRSWGCHVINMSTVPEVGGHLTPASLQGCNNAIFL